MIVAPPAATVADALAALGIAAPDGQELVFAHLSPGGARHFTIEEIADEPLDEQRDLYIASGAFLPGTAALNKRDASRLRSVLWLPFDLDLCDWLGVPRADLYGLSDADLDAHLAGQREDVERTFADLGLPIHRLDASGYGLCAYINIAPELQGEVALLRGLHKQLIRRINDHFGDKLADPLASDAGTRVTRLPGGLNTKGPIPRRSRTLYTRPGALDDARVRALARGAAPEPPGGTAVSLPRPEAGAVLSDAEAAAVVDALAAHWTGGNRHALALGLAGVLAKKGAPEEQARAIVEALAAGDEEARDRLAAVRDTYANLRAGRDVAGWSRLRDLGLDPTALDRLDGLLAPAGRAAGATPKHWPSESDPAWPELDPAALHGLAGEVVAAIGPHTEGDPAAVLVNYLVMVGNAIGGGPYAPVGAARHRTNLFAIHLGATSKARKGTAYTDTLAVVRRADPTWAQERTSGGLSSGEGLVYPIRDPIVKTRKGEPVTDDPGVSDKRLLVTEEEFSSVVKVASREGNTLSEQLRKAWDGRTLGVMTRNSPLRATGPHVSIIAHVTKDELLRVFDSTDAANGFGNRFLWVCVKRSKFLPEGGQLPEADAQKLTRETETAIEFARKQAEVRRDQAARDLWAQLYPELSSGGPGLLGALTARAEAHVLRLSLLYALLDRSSEIAPDHLVAALALWDYCVASVARVFGDSTGDPIADRIRSALRGNGPMAQSEISDMLGRNVSAARLGRALETLAAAGQVRGAREETGGRPRIVWSAC